MTCEQHCLHWEVCKLTPSEYATAKFYTFCNCAEKCECFKDKSKYIELPCKVGDTVYVLDEEYGIYGICKCIVNTIQLFANNRPSYELFYYTQRGDELAEIEWDIDVENDDFGKTVFLTKEDAEAKLEEMQDVR